MQSKSAKAIFLILSLLTSLHGPAANGTPVLLSTTSGATLGGLTIRDGDIAQYAPSTNTAALFFNEDLFPGEADINALSVLDNGNIVLSTNENETLGGLTFEDEDLVEYNPNTGVAILLFDGDQVFSGEEDIDAVHVSANGTIVLSTEGDATLGGLTIGDDDLALYDPDTGTASLLFDGGALFSNGFEDIDAVHLLDDGNILLSTLTGATLGGLTFEDGDLVEYNPNSDSASIFFDEDLYSADEDIDAVSFTRVPEPTSLALASLGLLMPWRRR